MPNKISAVVFFWSDSVKLQCVSDKDRKTFKQRICDILTICLFSEWCSVGKASQPLTKVAYLEESQQNQMNQSEFKVNICR